MNEREKEVFNMIINHYLNSGESVGSRTLEKKYNIGVSSATIRNVMSDLEEMGLITKTHTSSGRIPTLDGYRMYIDELLQVSEVDEETKEQIYLHYQKRINKTDIIFKETVKLLSELSRSVAIAIEPSSDEESIKKIQFIRITEKEVFVVVVMKNNIIKTSTLLMNTYVTEENVNNLNSYIFDLMNTTHKRFTLKDMERFLKNISVNDFRFEEKRIFENSKVFVDGAENLLSREDIPIEKVIGNIKMINNESEMNALFKHLISKVEYDLDSNIIFGSDIDIAGFEESVFIFKCYEFGEDKGVLGLIAQTRMDYSKTLALLDLVIDMLKKMLNQNYQNKFIGYKD
ncbi:heat-inducible transcriptional repressor HrcA [Streptobacillus moniliformis]|uniref:heat-inducible transcriptional repressor HrcA n=1 Tax=Streptobacillus moniliformis TaxID=34105 RepID=UPI0007E2FAF5|nr:heat-inducible transcriptional repressor HrcA [Streptobacillus moniliformis]